MIKRQCDNSTAYIHDSLLAHTSCLWLLVHICIHPEYITFSGCNLRTESYKLQTPHIVPEPILEFFNDLSQCQESSVFVHTQSGKSLHKHIVCLVVDRYIKFEHHHGYALKIFSNKLRYANGLCNIYYVTAKIVGTMNECCGNKRMIMYCMHTMNRDHSHVVLYTSYDATTHI